MCNRRWPGRACLLLVLLVCLMVSRHGLQAQAAGGGQNPPGQTYEGMLGVVWGDPHPISGSASDVRYTLTLPGGQMVLLRLSGQENLAALHYGKRVTVSGRAFQAQAARPGIPAAPAIDVDSLSLAASASPSTPQADAEASVFGTRKVIFLLVKFSDDAAVPHPATFFTDMTNPDTPPGGALFPSTINGFFKKTSYNQFSWTGDVGGVGGVGAPGGWLTLPHPKSFYAPCGWSSSCANLTTLGDDATALGRAQGINFKVYSNINFVLSNDLDCCAWGGSYFSSVDGQSYGATWEPPWGQNVPTYAHEMGHSIGLPHSGWVYYAYDSPWDVMSRVSSINSINCGSYLSANDGVTDTLFCSEPGGGYIGPHKDFLGWIPPDYQVITDTSSSITVTLEAAALPLGSLKKSIKICISGTPCTGSTAHFYTVEARVKGLGSTSQFDNGIPNEGIIVHDVLMNRAPISGPCFFNNQSGWAVPIDSTPGDYNSSTCSLPNSNSGLFNAQFAAGQTYTNGFTVNVLSRSGSTFVVSVISSTPVPTVATGGATSVTGTSATLTGTANPNSFTTTAHFDYGPTTAYGSSTSGQAMGAGSAAVAIGGGAIAGLSCSTVYHFRAAASNSAGTTNGPDATFTTAACASPTVATLAATSITATGATLNGTVNPNSADTNADFQYGLTTGYGATTSVQAMGAGSSAVAIGGGAISGLACNTPYHFRAVATNVAGSANGSDLTFTTAACPPPTVVTLAATNITATGVTLNGTVNPNGTSTTARFDYGLTTSYTSQVTASPAPGSGTSPVPVSGAIAGLVCGTLYHFRVVGTNASTANGADLTFTTAACLHRSRTDFDGDGRPDLAIYRPSTGGWSILTSGSNFATNLTLTLGSSTDIAVPGDYDGDHVADVAVYHANGQWDVRRSSTGTILTKAFGLNTDIPVPGDYDGDGKTDFAIYRPSAATWYYLPSSTGSPTPTAVVFGAAGDIPVPGDYDGDGKTDMALYRPSTGVWSIIQSSTSTTVTFTLGSGADRPVPEDYDGDGKTDIAVFHPSGLWSIRGSMTGTVVSTGFGLNTDVPVPGDYDGDGRADLAVFRPSDGNWYILQSSTGTVRTVALGQRGDRPLSSELPSRPTTDSIRARDFDGDRKADLTVFRPSEGKWYVLSSSSNYTTPVATTWGLSTDVPVPGDYDGDGRVDFAVYHRTGRWDVLLSSTNYTSSTGADWGLKTDIPVPGDYDGDGKTDFAVYRPSNNTWYVLQSSTNYTTNVTMVWGAPGDVPVPGDYDGDGLADFAVYRPTTGEWLIQLSSTNNTSSLDIPWGSLTDTPVPGDYDGDGRTDLAVYSNVGLWSVLLSSTNYTTSTQAGWGLGSDIPVPGDYDGDGKTDYAVYRPGAGTWFILQSGSNYTTSLSPVFGLITDVPAPGPGFSRSTGRTDGTRAGDYDGDGKRDLAVFTPAGAWTVRPSTAGYSTSASTAWGLGTDRPVPGDYDGDGRTDLAIFRPSDTTWYIRLSSTNFTTSLAIPFGTAADALVPGDYDGDGKTDIAVFHGGTWEILTSSSNFTTTVTVSLGVSGDIPVPGDYDGDGKTDVAVYHSGTWQILTSTSNFTTTVTAVLGAAGDVPVPGDYDGDGKTDVAVFHANGLWEALQSSTGFLTNLTMPWGIGTDVPVPGDYDGDGQTDFAIYRPSEGKWYLLLSTTNYTVSAAIALGTPAVDLPLPPQP